MKILTTLAQMSCESRRQNSHTSEILAFLISDLFSMSAMDNLDVKQNQLKFYCIQPNYSGKVGGPFHLMFVSIRFTSRIL